MKERLHKNKKYLSLFYDKLDSLLENFSDEEIGIIIRAAALYELEGKKTTMEDRALQIAVSGIYTDIDISTKKANEFSQQQREKAKGRWSRDKSAGMTPEEMDADIDQFCPRSKKE